MRIQVLFFAVLRERIGADSAPIELRDGALVRDALDEITRAFPAIASLIPRLQVAVNRRVVGHEHTLCDADELALIPPVAGGAGRRIAVLPTPLSLDEVVGCVEASAQGAIATFVGTVRRQGQQPNVARLIYEAYVPMAEQVLTEIADEIEREWPGTRVAIHHRTGSLDVGETAVVVAASAPHRAEAFDACRAGIERLKQRAPIWKKEIGDDGAEWIGLGP